MNIGPRPIGVRVIGRGSGVAIVYDGDAFVGRVIRVARSTGWHAYAVESTGRLRFVGFATRRADAVRLATGRPATGHHQRPEPATVQEPPVAA